MAGGGRGLPSTAYFPYGPHLALPAPRVAGVPISHPHALEGIVDDFPLMPDAGERGQQSSDVGALGADSPLRPSPSLPKDPAVGIPAEGLFMLGHVVERAEFILVPGSRGT